MLTDAERQQRIFNNTLRDIREKLGAPEESSEKRAPVDARVDELLQGMFRDAREKMPEWRKR